MNRMIPHHELLYTRRDFLMRAGAGFGGLALSYLLAQENAHAAEAATGNPLSPRPPHFPAKAKAVIFLFMEGGPSHLDTFDPKPELTRLNGQRLPPSFGKVITPMGTGGNKLLASKRTFRKYGRAGLDVSDWLPHIAGC